MRLKKWLRSYKKRWGLFGFIFPALGFLGAIVLLFVCLKYGANFDVLAWMASPKAIPIYFVVFIIVIAGWRLYCTL